MIALAASVALEGFAAARLVETTEAKAHFNLMTTVPTDLASDAGFTATTIGSAVAIRAPTVTTSLNLNRVIGLGILEPATEGMLDDIAAFYGVMGAPYGIELSPAAQPASLPDWLRARKLRKAFSSAVLYRSVEPPRVTHASWSKSTGLRVERICADHADDLARISVENFRMPVPVHRLIAALVDNPAWRCWLAFDGDRAVGGSLSYVEGDVCWLGWTSVMASHRGRWVHAGVVAREIEDAGESGCRWITTETATGTQKAPDPAYYNLTRFGFRDAYVRPTYMGRPAAAG